MGTCWKNKTKNLDAKGLSYYFIFLERKGLRYYIYCNSIKRIYMSISSHTDIVKEDGSKWSLGIHEKLDRN